jgi:hypothetical protein
MLSNKILIPAALIVGALLGGMVVAQGYPPGDPGPGSPEEVVKALEIPMQQLANFGPRVVQLDEKGGLLVYRGVIEACVPVGPGGPKPVWVDPVAAQRGYNAAGYISRRLEAGEELVIRFTDKCQTARSK